ncbi:hypothetical protein Halar_0297 (plasmid) [halophilic archaeon DL31]|nr:hypothetical protein Halar_0297 [halophilic archaeon DL31]
MLVSLRFNLAGTIVVFDGEVDLVSAEGLVIGSQFIEGFLYGEEIGFGEGIVGLPRVSDRLVFGNEEDRALGDVLVVLPFLVTDVESVGNAAMRVAEEREVQAEFAGERPVGVDAIARYRPDVEVGREFEPFRVPDGTESVPHKASSASCFCGLSSVSKRLY